VRGPPRQTSPFTQGFRTGARSRHDIPRGCGGFAPCANRGLGGCPVAIRASGFSRRFSVFRLRESRVHPVICCGRAHIAPALRQ